MVYQNNEFFTHLDDELKIDKKHYHSYASLIKSPSFEFVPPVFGITVIGASHGFDQCETTSGFIVWINSKGIMIDPPPFTS